jgi:hypothetical protein
MKNAFEGILGELPAEGSRTVPGAMRAVNLIGA